MPQQHIFGRNGGVGLELEHPMAVRALLRQQRLRRLLNVLLEPRRCGRPASVCFTAACAVRAMSLIMIVGLSAMVSAARLPDRIAPSMVAGRPVSVQSPARTRLRHLVTAPGRMASCAGVAAKVARRSRTICQGGSAAGNPVRLATSPQIVFASSSRGVSMSRSPALMVTESRPGKGEQPLHRAVEHAEDRRLRRRRLDAEMRVDDGAEFARHCQIAHQRRRDVRRHRKDDRVVGAKRNGVGAEIERLDPLGGKAQRAQLMLHAHRGAALLQMSQRRFDQASCPNLRARSAAGKRGRRPRASRG